MTEVVKLKEAASSLSILYVEDNDELSKNFKTYLLKIFSEVETASNGEEAFTLYKEKKFDIIITDINMPRMNGLTLTKKIKDVDKNQIVVLLSAYTDSKILIEAIRLGINGYLVKPINHIEINTLLYELCVSIKNSNENSINIQQQEWLMGHVRTKNTLLRQYTEIIDKVAIVSKTDLKGVITEVNDFFCEISGYTREELIGQNHRIVRHEDMASSVYFELWKTIKEGKVWKGTIKNKAKNGDPYFVHVTIIPLRDKDEKIEGYVGIRFLSTQEETEKREFRKKVRTNIIEYKKTNSHLLKKIEQLNKEISSKNENIEYSNIEELNTRLKKALSQIDFYEKNANKGQDKKYDVIEKYTKNLEHITQKYTESTKQLSLKKEEISLLKEDHREKKKELIKLNEELINQHHIIQDLRNTIKNISKNEDSNQKKKNKEEKEGSSIFGKYLKI
jgi:PAS domain S-box-containing protein